MLVPILLLTLGCKFDIRDASLVSFLDHLFHSILVVMLWTDRLAVEFKVTDFIIIDTWYALDLTFRDDAEELILQSV